MEFLKLRIFFVDDSNNKMPGDSTNATVLQVYKDTIDYLNSSYDTTITLKSEKPNILIFSNNEKLYKDILEEVQGYLLNPDDDGNHPIMMGPISTLISTQKLKLITSNVHLK